jgi:hypothetical protein
VEVSVKLTVSGAVPFGGLGSVVKLAVALPDVSPSCALTNVAVIDIKKENIIKKCKILLLLTDVSTFPTYSHAFI